MDPSLPWKRLGLEQTPFEEGPAGESYFVTPALEERLNLAHHLVHYSDHLIVVTGPPGAGKTSFLERLISGGVAQWRSCAIPVPHPYGVNTLLDRILGGLALPAPPPRSTPAQERLLALAGYLEDRVRAGDLAVIAIDDAQRLEDDALELVVELALRSPSLKARFVMAANAELIPTLAAAVEGRGGGDILHVIEIPALGVEETRDYIHARLRAAGMHGDTPFAPDRAARIC